MVKSTLLAILDLWHGLVEKNEFRMMWHNCMGHDDNRPPAEGDRKKAISASRNARTTPEKVSSASKKVASSKACSKAKKASAESSEEEISIDIGPLEDGEDEEKDADEQLDPPAKTRVQPRRKSTAKKLADIENDDGEDNGEDGDYSNENEDEDEDTGAGKSMDENDSEDEEQIRISEDEITLRTPSVGKGKGKAGPKRKERAPTSGSDADSEDNVPPRKKVAKGKEKAAPQPSPSPPGLSKESELPIPMDAFIKSMQDQDLQYSRLVNAVFSLSVSLQPYFRSLLTYMSGQTSSFTYKKYAPLDSLAPSFI